MLGPGPGARARARCQGQGQVPGPGPVPGAYLFPSFSFLQHHLSLALLHLLHGLATSGPSFFSE